MFFIFPKPVSILLPKTFLSFVYLVMFPQLDIIIDVFLLNSFLFYNFSCYSLFSLWLFFNNTDRLLILFNFEVAL